MHEERGVGVGVHYTHHVEPPSVVQWMRPPHDGPSVNPSPTAQHTSELAGEQSMLLK